MKAHTAIIFAKPQHLIALLFFIFSWPVLAHGADTDWGTDLYWEGIIATSGSTSYTGRLYYTRLGGGGVTITGISFDSTPADGCTIYIPETVGSNAAMDSVFVVNRPGRYSSVSVNKQNWRNTPLRWKNAPNSFALSLPGTLRELCPLIQAANYSTNDTWVNSMTIPNTALTKLIIRDNTNAHPSARLRIGDHAFYDSSTSQLFTALKSVSFGYKSVLYIGEHAFRGCPITSISQFNEGLKTIGSYAFLNLHVEQDLILPNTLQHIGDYALGEVGSQIKTEYGWFFHNQLTIPAGMKYIGVGAFCGSRKVRMTVTIPEGVEYIGGLAFSNTFITSLVIPSTVKTIRGGAFREMRMLETVTFKPNTVLTSIGDNLFANDIGLRYIDMSAINNLSLNNLKVSRKDKSPFFSLAPYTMIYLPQSATSAVIPSTEVNFVHYSADGQWVCPNFVVYDYAYWYDCDHFDYSNFISDTGSHYALNSMTTEEKQAVSDWKASLPANRGCEYELPHAFTATTAKYLRRKGALQPGSIITVSLPYNTTAKDKNVKAYKLVSEIGLAGSKNNKGLWFLSLDDSRISPSALTKEERDECLTACHPYVLKILSVPADTTFKDGYYDEHYQKFFDSQHVFVPATTNGYTEVDPADGSSEWSAVGSYMNIDNATAAADHLYVLSGGVWNAVRTRQTSGYVHSMRSAIRYKGTDANYAKSFPKILDTNEPLSTDATNINAANADLAPTATRIYSLNGRCVGSSLSSLPRGIYIVNGRKIWR